MEGMQQKKIQKGIFFLHAGEHKHVNIKIVKKIVVDKSKKSLVMA
jgi:hypothetical protein